MKDQIAKLRFPIESFKCCPSCGSANLEEFIDIHVLCPSCQWDSTECFVESGGMDALIYEYETMLEQQELMKSLEAVKATKQETCQRGVA